MTSKPPAEILPDSDWTKRYHAISFRKLMNVVKHNTKKDTYLSTSAAYPPSAATRTYGGHVFAQAAWAAAHTVPYGQHIHSISGWFLLLGDTRYAFEYRIRRIRDGGVYALRIIEAYQNSEAGGHGKTPTFIAVVSFKRDERNKHKQGVKGQRQDFEHQELPHNYLNIEYGSVLRNKSFSDWPLSQGVDGMWVKDGLSIAEWKQRGNSFPGLEMRKVDMSGYNGIAPLGGHEDGGETARKWRLLTYYKLLIDEEDTKQSERKTGADDLINLHACAHSYATDRNSLFQGQRALGFQLYQGHVGSLSHTVNYHGHASDWKMVDDQNNAKEFMREEWISSSGADRVTHQCRLWDLANGRIIVSTVQDGMMRIPMAPVQEVTDADALFRREAKL